MTNRFGLIDFDRFHRIELPDKLADGPLPDLGSLRPIAFRLKGGSAFTYAPTGPSIDILPGEDGASTIVELSHNSWSDFVWELRTCFALLYADELSFARGGMGDLARWEPVLRAILDRQQIYNLAGPPPVLDADGKQLDLERSFTLDDSHDAIRDFLSRAGFVHICSVFGADEIESLRSEVQAAIGQARPDDRRSWWTTVDGRDVCNRVNYLNERSELIARLSTDRRMRRIGNLAGAKLRDATDRMDGHSVVIKVPGATTGLADLPWHRDCGMGGHPVKCPLLNVGIQLDAATPEAGQLQMIAGSHLGTSRLPSNEETRNLPVVALTTQPSDVTVHFGHTLHAAPPPVDPTSEGRRALYVTYVQPAAFDVVGPGQGYNDVVFARDSGHVPHAREMD